MVDPKQQNEEQEPVEGFPETDVTPAFNDESDELGISGLDEVPDTGEEDEEEENEGEE